MVPWNIHGIKGGSEACAAYTNQVSASDVCDPHTGLGTITQPRLW